MRVLHLSDLHLSGEHRRFEDVWGVVAKVLDERYKDGVDAIVVSGDLTYSASVKEYERLLHFAVEKLCRRLRSGIQEERWRVVFVPGNHDVDWGAPLGFHVPGTDDVGAGAAFAKELAVYRKNPGSSDLRAVPGRQGQAEYVRIEHEVYRRRLENFQKFLDDFYKPVETSPRLRKFCLLDQDEQHWSAHFFEEDQVVFLGFNSCRRNDRYWTGAEIDTGAIEQAAEHVKAREGSYRQIAVWHHGIVSDPGRPDALTLRDLGHLFTRSVRVGLHGHVHDTEEHTPDAFFGERFLILSAGSLGAPAADRAPTIGNQFSVMEITGPRASVTVYEARGRALVPRLVRARSYDLEATSTNEPPPEFARHEREYRIDPDGILTTQVRLYPHPGQAHAHARYVLGIVTPPFCNVDGDVKTKTGGITVNVDDLPGGRRIFTADCTIGAGTEMAWTYAASNAIALRAGESGFTDSRLDWMPRLEDGYEGRTHTVRIASERLVMTIQYVGREDRARTDVFDPESRMVLVERPSPANGREEWLLDSRETTRARRFLTSSDGALSLDLPGPALGWRYTIAYRMKARAQAHTDAAGRLQKRLLIECLKQTDQTGGVDTQLANAISTATAAALNTAALVSGPWLGLLWYHPEKRLVTAFGKFSRPAWAVRFAYGEGIAGHAFRMGLPAAWHRDVARNNAIIYKSGVGMNDPIEHNYGWVLCLPLLIKDAAPLGVISFAGIHDAEAPTDSDDRLEAAVRSFCREKTLDGLNDVWNAVNVAFWEVLASSDASRLNSVDKEFCGETLAWLRTFPERTTVPPAAPTASGGPACDPFNPGAGS